MRLTRLTLLGLVVVVLVAVAACRMRQPSGQEPTVSVVVDPETGATEDMPLERYVMGVVGGEMGQLPAANGEEQDWPEAAYAAQAILARTFILTWLEDHPNRPISTDVTEAQAYRPENITPAIERAVESTRGKVIRHNGQLVKTWFHSFAGGKTATAKEGLNYQEDEPAYIQSVQLEENEFAPDDVQAWSVAIPLQQLEAALAEAGINVGSIRAVRIDEVGPSGRVTKVTVEGTAGTASIHGAEFRLRIGPEVLKSTLVDRQTFRVEDGRLVAQGTGFGHGVGLSQWDAYKLAKEGKSPEEIVQTFFADIEITREW